MDRIPVAQRPDREETALAHGFEITPGEGIPYWDETAYYQFSLHQIETDLEAATDEVQRMCFELLERAIRDEAVFQQLKVPPAFWDFIADSWRTRQKDLYGRMDFSYGGQGSAKLLEYNGDTPTLLYESAVFQWVWLEQAIEQRLVPERCDQFNEMHEDFVAAFSTLGIEGLFHLACQQDIEDDRGTVEYLEECAQEAGLETCSLDLKEIGVDANGRFTDRDDLFIDTLFKLYPWEWMMEEEFGRHLPNSRVRFIEPPWKAILSNKGILPLLWEMFEGHPNLLPAYFEGDPRAADLSDGYVRKPLLSRQGGNVEIAKDGRRIAHVEGPYGQEGFILQAYHPLPKFSGNYPVVGSWLVAGRSAGISIREDRDLITGETARFIPHVILD